MPTLAFNPKTVVTTICTGSGREIFYQTATGDPQAKEWRYLEDDEVFAFRAFRAANPDFKFAVFHADGE
jgi:hypothetical protein